MLKFLLKSEDVLYQVSSDLDEINSFYSSFTGKGQNDLACLSKVQKKACLV